MNVELSPEQKRAREAQHRKCRDRRVCDRIRCVLLSAEGWSASMIAKSQLIDETTVRRHLHDWLNEQKLAPENGGYDGILSAQQTEKLIKQLFQHLFHHIYEVVSFDAQCWGITGISKWLHRQGFSYKKPTETPDKFSEEKQQQFIEYYEKLKGSVQDEDEPILFLDAAHPTQVTKLSYGWIRKGHRKSVKTTGSSTRLNILGGLNLHDIGGAMFQDYQTIDELSVSRFFNEIIAKYQNYHKKIYLIVDGAAYNKTDLAKDWTYVSNIELYYLPSYSPNLNKIERLWKLINEHAKNNCYFARKHDYRSVI